MNLNTGLLRISRARPLFLLHNAASSSPLFPARKSMPVSAASAKLMSTGTGTGTGSTLRSQRPRPHTPRLPAASITIAQRRSRASTEAAKPTPPASSTTSSSSSSSSTPESRGPPAVSIPYDPKSPPPPPPPPPTPIDPIPLSLLLNPPASTRPPPLSLPTRDPKTASRLSHLFQLGKAYMQFYKAGLKAIFTNRRLLSSIVPPTSPSGAEGNWPPTRAAILLRSRTRHDLARLPVFAVLLLVCGEFTPLLVLAFPRLAPLTCRIPRQVEALRRGAAARREASFRALSVQRGRLVFLQEQRQQQQQQQQQQQKGNEEGKAVLSSAEKQLASGHIARSLGLVSQWWDRAGLDGPLATRRADRAVAFLARDDALIRAGGGVAQVEDEEVVLACEGRGMDVRGKEVGELRKRLEAWVGESEGVDEVDSRDRVRRLLLDPELSF